MSLKPIRSGYKVWYLNLQGGYLYNVEVYQSKGSTNKDADYFGLGSSVVIGLVKSLSKSNFSVFKYLEQKNIGCTGKMKTNMSQDCSLPPKSEFKKHPKRSYPSRAKWWCRNGNLE